MEPYDPNPPLHVLFQHVYIAAKLLSPSRDNPALERGPWIDVGKWVIATYGHDSSAWEGYEMIRDPRQTLEIERRECVSDLLVSLLDRLRPYIAPEP